MSVVSSFCLLRFSSPCLSLSLTVRVARFDEQQICTRVCVCVGVCSGFSLSLSLYYALLQAKTKLCLFVCLLLFFVLYSRTSSVSVRYLFFM